MKEKRNQSQKGIRFGIFLLSPQQQIPTIIKNSQIPQRRQTITGHTFSSNRKETSKILSMCVITAGGNNLSFVSESFKTSKR